MPAPTLTSTIDWPGFGGLAQHGNFHVGPSSIHNSRTESRCECPKRGKFGIVAETLRNHLNQRKPMASPSAPTPAAQVAASATAKQSALRKIDEIAESAMAFFGKPGSLEEELRVAQAMTDLRNALTPEVMAPIMALMNTNIGFKTDRDPNRPGRGQPTQPYTMEVVRECFIESRLRGFHSVGNEWNIISSQFYAAKNGLDRKVKNFPGVTDFRMFFDVPEMKANGATVKCKATWIRDGVADSLDAVVPVKVNEYMGADAVLGKATRKLLARVHDRLTGTTTPEAEVGDDPPMIAPQMPSAPLFQTPPPSSPVPEDKTPPSPLSGAAKGAPAAAPVVNQPKQKAIIAVGELMKADNIGIDQVIVFMRQRGDIPPDSMAIEDAATSKLLGLIAVWDSVKDQMSAIEV